MRCVYVESLGAHPSSQLPQRVPPSEHELCALRGGGHVDVVRLHPSRHSTPWLTCVCWVATRCSVPPFCLGTPLTTQVILPEKGVCVSESDGCQKGVVCHVTTCHVTAIHLVWTRSAF